MKLAPLILSVVLLGNTAKAQHPTVPNVPSIPTIPNILPTTMRNTPARVLQQTVNSYGQPVVVVAYEDTFLNAQGQRVAYVNRVPCVQTSRVGSVVRQYRTTCMPIVQFASMNANRAVQPNGAPQPAVVNPPSANQPAGVPTVYNQPAVMASTPVLENPSSVMDQAGLDDASALHSAIAMQRVPLSAVDPSLIEDRVVTNFPAYGGAGGVVVSRSRTVETRQY